MTRLLEEGVILIPVISANQDPTESDIVKRRLPDLLNRLDSPIPCVIGTYLDAVKSDQSEDARKDTALTFWGDKSKSDDVLLCSPVWYISAKFVLHYISNHASKPPTEDVWDKHSDPRYSVC